MDFSALSWPYPEEGRTVLLSSHLLDEVEKTCDVAAIVDQGRIVAQGTIAELVSGGPRAIDIVCHSAVTAIPVLAAIPGVLCAADHAGAIRVSLSPEAGCLASGS